MSALQPPGVLSVKEAIGVLNGLIKPIPIVVTGEIAEANLNQGKYWFFTLRDGEGDASLSCFMMAMKIPFPLENGMKILVSGNFGVYEKNGRLSLTVNQLRASGEGSLARAFELLKAKLVAEGLANAERKRQIPEYVQKVALISSVEAAGYGDFIRIARTRFPGLQIVHIQTSVQGKSAEDEIVQALGRAQKIRDAEVIALVRGGGSAEDLHAFNSEPVARAIAESILPVVVGVGHERDMTIADLVADFRASTPSNAAEIIVPDAQELIRSLMLFSQQRKQILSIRFARAAAVVQQFRELRKHTLLQKLEISKRTIEVSRDMRVQNLRHHSALLKLQVKRMIEAIGALAPNQVLTRGYALVRSEGKIVQNCSDFTARSATLIFRDGTVEVTRQK